jgi:hypothetical protein
MGATKLFRIMKILRVVVYEKRKRPEIKKQTYIRIHLSDKQLSFNDSLFQYRQESVMFTVLGRFRSVPVEASSAQL